MDSVERELSAAKVRRLPEMTRVYVHGRDRYGYPTRTLCFVHRLPNGRTVLHPIGMFVEGFVEIRRGTRYTVEVGT